MMQFVRRCTQVLDPVHWPKLRVFVSWLQNRYWGPFTAPQHIWPVPTQLAPVHALQSGRGTLSPEIIETRLSRRAAFRSNDLILPAGFWNTDLTNLFDLNLFENEKRRLWSSGPCEKANGPLIDMYPLYTDFWVTCYEVGGCRFTHTVGSLGPHPGLNAALLFHESDRIGMIWSDMVESLAKLEFTFDYPTNRRRVRFQGLA